MAHALIYSWVAGYSDLSKTTKNWKAASTIPRARIFSRSAVHATSRFRRFAFLWVSASTARIRTCFAWNPARAKTAASSALTSYVCIPRAYTLSKTTWFSISFPAWECLEKKNPPNPNLPQSRVEPTMVQAALSPVRTAARPNPQNVFVDVLMRVDGLFKQTGLDGCSVPHSAVVFLEASHNELFPSESTDCVCCGGCSR